MEDCWCYLIIGSLILIIILYGLFDIHYFLRMCLCVILARCVKRKCHILDTTTVTGVCLTTDIDTLLSHMNNARYFRELDFARVDFYERTKLYRTIKSKGGSVFQGAATIRYRRFIKPFHRFTIESRIIYWDDQSVFMEHRFKRTSDQFIHSIAICRQRIIDCSAEEIMNELSLARNRRTMSTTATTNLHASSHDDILNSTNSLENALTMATTNIDQAENGQVARVKWKPEIPMEIQKWIEYNDISSKNLRKGC